MTKNKFKKYYLDYSLKNNEHERWVPVIDYEDLYEVSNKGRIKSLPREKKTANKKGYHLTPEKIRKQAETIKNGHIIDTRIQLNFYGEVKMHQVSRLVYFSFNRLEDPNDGEFIIHKNKIGYDNRLRNLIKGSRLESRKYDKEISPRFKKACMQNLAKAEEIRLKKARSPEKECTKCEKTKKAEEFRYGSRVCRKCSNRARNERRKKARNEVRES